MKHKLSYSLLLSLVVLFSFSLAQAQTVDIVGPDPADDPLLPNTTYCYDVVVNGAAGVTSFTAAVDVSGAGFVSGSITTQNPLAGLVVQVVGDQVQLGYVGAPLGDPATLVTICITTTAACGADVIIDANGSFPPAGGPMFAAGGCFVAVQPGAILDTLYNGTPVCGINDDEQLACLDAIVDKQINATEPIGLTLTYNQIAGEGSTDPVTGLYNYDPADDACDHDFEVQVEVSNPCGNTVTCSFHVYYDQEAPVITCPADQTEHWSEGVQSYVVSATDDGCPTPPGDVTFSIVDVVPAHAVNIINDDPTASDATIEFDPECADIGMTFTITVEVTDGCEVDQCDFDVTVTNTPPTITCPTPPALWYSYMGDMGPLPFTAGDAEDPITVSIFETSLNTVPTAPIGPMWIDGTYNFHFDPEWLDEGTWLITLEVDDGCEQTYCSFSFEVLGKFFLCLDSTSVYSGHNATITLNVTNSMATGGFDYLLSYDPTIAFLDAEPVGDLLDWEYFTYRKSNMDNCGGGCPTGLIRLIAIANTPDGIDPGDVYHLEGPIVELTFATPSDFDYLNQCFHVSWTWFDCGDNSMSSLTGDTLFIGQHIDYVDGEWCLDPDKGYLPLPRINFCDGIICIIPPVDDRGDINLNGIANEIADAVYYSNYFIYGPSAWGGEDDPYYPNKVLASDVNDDGIPQTIADLVYLIRIITGDAIPYGESGEGGKIAPYVNAADVGYEVNGDMVVSAYSPVSVGGAAFVFRHTGEIGTPVLTDKAAGMTLRSSDTNGELRVLVFSMDNNAINAGSHDLFTMPLENNTIELVQVQMSDAEGNLLTVNSNKIAPPTEFALLQNYPNPFNAGTAIRFALPVASDWSVGIYNVAGQLVKEFKGSNEAGMVNLHWDAANAASGIYFYKLTAGDFTANKKMVLMK